MYVVRMIWTRRFVIAHLCGRFCEQAVVDRFSHTDCSVTAMPARRKYRCATLFLSAAQSTAKRRRKTETVVGIRNHRSCSATRDKTVAAASAASKKIKIARATSTSFVARDAAGSLIVFCFRLRPSACCQHNTKVFRRLCQLSSLDSTLIYLLYLWSESSELLSLWVEIGEIQDIYTIQQQQEYIYIYI